MSIFTEKMKMLTAVVMETDRDAVVKALLAKGVMEFVRMDFLPADKMARLSGHSSSVPRAVLTDMRVRIETLMREAGIDLPDLESVDIGDLPPLDMESNRRLLDRVSGSLQSVRNSQKELNTEINEISELLRYQREGKMEYLDLRVGRITHSTASELLSRLSQIGGIFLFSSEPYISLTLKRDSQRISDVMDKFGWTESTDSEEQKAALDEAVGKARADIEEKKRQLEELSHTAAGKIAGRKDELSSMWVNVRIHELCEHVESKFSYTKNTTLFSGWVPADRQDEVERTIYESSSGRCIIEWTDASDLPREEVPVMMTSPKILNPFRRMVDNYSTPEYGSIDPTPFTAVAYLAMFALMFADLGQGFILLLAGIIGTIYYKKNPLKKDGIISRYLCNLLLYLGPASMIGGILFGSCFGLPVFPALWFEYEAVVAGTATEGLITTIYDILGITIKFGIVIIYLGLVLNWINLVRKKRFFELVFDKNGIMGGLIYTLGIWFAFGFVGSGYRTFPSASWFAPILIASLIVLFLRGPVGYIIAKKNGKAEGGIGHLVVDTIMDFVVQVLEIFSGFLSNTLSFMRVAGLGIAHASLMSAFYQMAEMPGNTVAYIAIALIGNVLVIVLEGLSAGIQSLRLNYYEFFTKYFTGKGIAFEPVSFKSRIVAD